MDPLVQLDRVSVTLHGRKILRQVSWRLRPGEHWAFVGGNGSGKTTLLRLIRGELWPDPDSRGVRTYSFAGDRQTTAVGVRERIALVSPELQERYLRQEWRLTARDVIHTGFHATELLYHRPNAEQRALARRWIELFGIERLLARDMQTLSTGELRKVLIARALAGGPAALICDEICDGLDPAARASLLKALENVARAGTQLIVATHRPEEFPATTTHVFVLRNGRGRARPARTSLQRGASEIGPARSAGDELRKSGAGIGRAPGVGANGGALIRMERATVYLHGKRVLRDVTWEWRRGEHWAVVGPNGAGKSTFLKLVIGDLHPAAGSRVQRFTFTPRNTLWELRRRIGFVSPEFQSAYRERISVEGVIASGFFSSVGLIERVTPARRRRVAELMEAHGLARLAGRDARRLSYGEFRRVLLARALVHRPELLALDEPFDGLDPRSKAALGKTLEQVAGAGTSLLIVTHHVADLPRCMTHRLELNAGWAKAW